MNAPVQFSRRREKPNASSPMHSIDAHADRRRQARERKRRQQDRIRMYGRGGYRVVKSLTLSQDTLAGLAQQYETILAAADDDQELAWAISEILDDIAGVE